MFHINVLHLLASLCCVTQEDDGRSSLAKHLPDDEVTHWMRRRVVDISGAGKDFWKGRIAAGAWQAVSLLCSEAAGLPVGTVQVAPGLKMTQY